MRGQLLGNKLLLTMKKKDLVKIFFVLRKLLNIVWIRNRNRNRNCRNFSEVRTRTGTVTKHYGSTTLVKSMVRY